MEDALLPDVVEDALTRVFQALADPIRRRMLSALRAGELTVTELARPFPVSLPAITKHLKVLERAGLITRSRDAQQRPCRLRAAALRDADAWIATYRRYWESRFDQLDDYLVTLQDGSPSEKGGTDDSTVA